MSKKRGFKATTLACINRALRLSGLSGVTAAKDSKRKHSMVLRFDDEEVGADEVEQAKEVTAAVMGPMGWWSPRKRP